jgi:hypothetical protein
MRAAAVAGQFYAGRAGKLKAQVEECYKHPIGPGKLPPRTKLAKERKLKGLVVPHAGYQFSGPVAAHSYYRLAQEGYPDTFIILGPNHTGMGTAVALTTETFKMPMGDVKVDEPLAKALWTGIIDNDPNAHRYEHSIEVQLPFLQYSKSDIKFVPICMSLMNYDTAIEVGEIIASAAKNKNVVIVASTDFTHCGLMYGQPCPPGMNAGKFAKEQDIKAIKAILALDIKGMFDAIERYSITMCGYGPVGAMLIAAKKLGAREGKLLKYASSYDIMPGDSAVGYGAIAIE